MRTRLRLFLDWGITFGQPYEVPEKSARKVHYADKQDLEIAIIEDAIAHGAKALPKHGNATSRPAAGAGMQHTPRQETAAQRQRRSAAQAMRIQHSEGG